MSAKPTLRDTVLAGLAKLPNATRLGLTVASSTPKRTTALFPYASPSSSVRCWETEHLVVVDCGLPVEEPSTANGQSSETTSPAGSVLAAAISVNVYTLPSNKNGTPTSVVYISKVDSSGYASSAPGLTRELAIGVLVHFLAPETRPTPRVVATLFARSQGQYLFPNSIEGGGKRVLGGLGLCQWWKSVYEGAAQRLVDAHVGTADLELRYLLPSYSAAEAKGMLRPPVAAPPVQWQYAPPFVAELLPTGSSLAVLIPSLPDDPKTRFLDELASEALEARPYTHNSHNSHAPSTNAEQDSTPAVPTSPKKRKREAIEDEEDRRRTHAALSKIPAAEFWERIGFRQECSSGDVTGFFALSVTPAKKEQGGDVAAAVNVDAEAGEPEAEAETESKATSAPVPTSSVTALPPSLVERLLKSLLNTDFGTRALAADGTRNWLDSARRLVVDEVGEAGWETCTAEVPAKAGDAGAGRKRREEVVTVLQVRKRKK